MVDKRLDGLRPTVRRAVREYLSPSDPDHDDMVQLALMGTARYLVDTERADDLDDDGLERLAAAIARNRCRDLARRRKVRSEVELESLEAILVAPCPSILDDLEQNERYELLARGIRELPQRSRRLLVYRYLEGASLQDMMEEFGFGSVQLFYYHRNLCLENLRTFLNRWLV